MLIGGGKLVKQSLRRRERLLRESQYDVEEISRYGELLNPVNLFWRGSTFELGRLFLTDQRLMLLPYSRDEVDRAHLLQDLSYKLLDKVGMGIPKPKIEFTSEPLLIELEQIQTVNPFQRQFGIHPTLQLHCWDGMTYRFKFVSGDSPQEWAEEIAELTGSSISDRQTA